MNILEKITGNIFKFLLCKLIKQYIGLIIDYKTLNITGHYNKYPIKIRVLNGIIDNQKYNYKYNGVFNNLYIYINISGVSLIIDSVTLNINNNDKQIQVINTKNDIESETINDKILNISLQKLLWDKLNNIFNNINIKINNVIIDDIINSLNIKINNVNILYKPSKSFFSCKLKNIIINCVIGFNIIINNITIQYNLKLYRIYTDNILIHLDYIKIYNCFLKQPNISSSNKNAIKFKFSTKKIIVKDKLLNVVFIIYNVILNQEKCKIRYLTVLDKNTTYIVIKHIYINFYIGNYYIDNIYGKINKIFIEYILEICSLLNISHKNYNKNIINNLQLINNYRSNNNRSNSNRSNSNNEVINLSDIILYKGYFDKSITNIKNIPIKKFVINSSKILIYNFKNILSAKIFIKKIIHNEFTSKTKTSINKFKIYDCSENCWKYTIYLSKYSSELYIYNSDIVKLQDKYYNCYINLDSITINLDEMLLYELLPLVVSINECSKLLEKIMPISNLYILNTTVKPFIINYSFKPREFNMSKLLYGNITELIKISTIRDLTLSIPILKINICIGFSNLFTKIIDQVTNNIIKKKSLIITHMGLLKQLFSPAIRANQVMKMDGNFIKKTNIYCKKVSYDLLGLLTKTSIGIENIIDSTVCDKKNNIDQPISKLNRSVSDIKYDCNILFKSITMGLLIIQQIIDPEEANKCKLRYY